MTKDDDRDLAQPQRQHIHRVLIEMYRSMDMVMQHLVARGDVPEETRQELQTDLVAVISTLRKYRSEDHVDWQELTPVDGGPEAILKATARGDVDQTVSAHTRNPQPRRTKAAYKIDASTLYEAALEMDDMAASLGFAPHPQRQLDRENPDPV